jgi:hypothetical protein
VEAWRGMPMPVLLMLLLRVLSSQFCRPLQLRRAI